MLAVGGLGIQAALAARALSGISGKSLFGGPADIFTGGKGGALSKMAKVGGGLAAVAGGFALDYGSEKLTQAGHIKTGAATDVASSALSGAGLGATIGSIVPGVGTAIGATIGGAGGAAYGLYKNAGSLFGMGKTATPVAQPVTPPPAVPGGAVAGTPSTAGPVNTAAAQAAAGLPGVLNTADIGANQKLSTMVDRMTEMVTLLKEMKDLRVGTAPATPPAVRVPTQSPTALQYQTGLGL
jgi:hypothetical protein